MFLLQHGCERAYHQFSCVCMYIFVWVYVTKKSNLLSEATWSLYPLTFCLWGSASDKIRFFCPSALWESIISPSWGVKKQTKISRSGTRSLTKSFKFMSQKIFGGSLNWDLFPDCGNVWWLVQKSTNASALCCEVNNFCDAVLTSLLLHPSKRNSYS